MYFIEDIYLPAQIARFLTVVAFLCKTKQNLHPYFVIDNKTIV